MHLRRYLLISVSRLDVSFRIVLIGLATALKRVAPGACPEAIDIRLACCSQWQSEHDFIARVRSYRMDGCAYQGGLLSC